MENEKYGKWFPEKIEGNELQEFAGWLNSWADYNKHDESLNGNYITEFGKGYRKAVGDIIEKTGLDFKLFDKRTKTGFKLQRHGLKEK